jgi:hypothetical protein
MMPALCLSELERDLSLQPQPKWQMTDAGQWVQNPIIRTRANSGWLAMPRLFVRHGDLSDFAIFLACMAMVAGMLIGIGAGQ